MTDSIAPEPYVAPAPPPASLMAPEPAGAPVPPPGYVLAPVAPPVRSKRLGLIAFIVAISLFVATIVVSVIIGIGAVPFTVQTGGGFHYFLDASSTNPAEAALGVASLVQGFLGSALGVWAFVQGIVAVATRRGRAFGVAAIVFATLGPIVTAGVTLATVAINLH
jgi:hypothetical protein